MSDLGGVDPIAEHIAEHGVLCRCGRTVNRADHSESATHSTNYTNLNGTWKVAMPPTIEELIGQAPSGPAIHEVAQEAERMLLEKNISYGDSALNPINVFAKGLDATHLLQVRIDDKLARISNAQHYPGDDDVLDLIGYLLLLRIANRP